MQNLWTRERVASAGTVLMSKLLLKTTPHKILVYTTSGFSTLIGSPEQYAMI